MLPIYLRYIILYTSYYLMNQPGSCEWCIVIWTLVHTEGLNRIWSGVIVHSDQSLTDQLKSIRVTVLSSVHSVIALLLWPINKEVSDD